MDAEISVVSLSQLASTSLPPPAIIDVRRAAAFARDPWMIAGAVRRLPDLEAWQVTLEPWRTVVVYCAHGGEVSRDIAAALAQRRLRMTSVRSQRRSIRSCKAMLSTAPR